MEREENKIRSTEGLAETVRNAEQRRTADFATWFAEFFEARGRRSKTVVNNGLRGGLAQAHD
jgi:hypothetical protein